jgi:hypothetical protein
LESSESFSKPAKLVLDGFQKWRALCCRLFKREMLIKNMPVLKTGEIGPGQFSKILKSAAFRNLLPNRSEGFELEMGLKSFQKTQLSALNR